MTTLPGSTERYCLQDMLIVDMDTSWMAQVVRYEYCSFIWNRSRSYAYPCMCFAVPFSLGK